MAFRGAVLFDLDGTLVDTAQDFVHVIQTMQRHDNIAITDALQIRNTVSDGARALIKLGWQYDEEHPLFAAKHQQMLDYYWQSLGEKAALFDGYPQLFDFLHQHNIGWGIVTNKPWRFTEALLQRLNLQPSNQVAICPDHVTHSKPHAEPLLLAAQKLQLQPEQCLYVGDHERDIAAAINANMLSIACAYGYIKENDNISNWNADYIINHSNELHNIVKNYFKL
jgi:N-acetyl-D-muramate 6-phosphate phosphatase